MKVSKNNNLLLTILGVLLAFTSPAQTPCFTADHDTVCVGTPVTFTSCPGWNNVIYNFGDGSGYRPLGVNSVVYSEPGTKQVLQKGNDTNNDETEEGPLNIVVIKPTAPLFSLSSCSGRQVSLTLTDKVYQNYSLVVDSNPAIPISKGSTVNIPFATAGSKTIKITGTSTSGCVDDTTYIFEVFENIIQPIITNIASGEGQISVLIDPASLKGYLDYKVYVSDGGNYFDAGDLVKQNDVYGNKFVVQSVPGIGVIDPSKKSYCIKVTAIDNCGDQVSSQGCSILVNAKALPDQNNVTWNSNTSFGNFSLNENTTQISFPGNVFSYQNNLINCNTNYCYSVKATAGTLTVISNQVCVKGVSNKIPQEVKDLVASVENNQIKVSWSTPPNVKVKSFTLQKADGVGYKTVYTGQLNEFKDNQKGVSACYQIFYTDSCNNISPTSLPSCSVLLKGELVDKDNNSLQWNEYKEFESGIKQYYLQYLDEDDQVVDEIPLGISTGYSDLRKNESQIVRYRIKVESNDPTPLVSFSNIVPIKQNFLILLPNAFTPNGDGRNETFHPVGLFIKSYVMQIYNKWGELIFEGKIWEGQGKSGTAPSGTYVCYVEAEDFTGEKFIKKGTVILIR